MRNNLDKLTKQEEKELNEIPLHTSDKNIPLDALVSLPTVQINEITHGDSLELTGCVPAKADLILEDMPYNTTTLDFDKEPIDLKKYWESRLDITKPTGVFALTASQPFTTDLLNSNRKMFKYEWIWEKTIATGMAQSSYMPMKYHENILIFYKHKPTFNKIMMERSETGKVRAKTPIYWSSHKSNHVNIGKQDAKQYDPEQVNPKSIIRVNSVPNSGGLKLHPTQKPVGLFEYLIRTYTNEGDLVFDGFGGSGTTAIAAYRTKRNFIVIEKDKKYFEIASKRLYQERNPLSNFDEAS